MDDLLSDILSWKPRYCDKNKLSDFLKKTKEIYKNELLKTHLDKSDYIFFSWASQPLCIYLIRVSDKLSFKSVIAFATEDSCISEDKINYFDKTEETNNAQFIHANSFSERLQLILNDKSISNSIDPKNIIKNSIFTLSLAMNTQIWIDTWFDNEFKHTKQHFSIPPIKLKFNDLGLHSNKYKLKKIINTIDDPQFSRELSECMNAFEEEYYYPAATGLGGIMESLLYKTLENYKRTSSRLIGSDPTLSNYLGALKRFGLIDRRQRNRIKAAFMIRNSISHFNQGFTEVDDVQSMLHGIENIYTTLYLPSLKWKATHPGKQLPEPNHHNQ